MPSPRFRHVTRSVLALLIITAAASALGAPVVIDDFEEGATITSPPPTVLIGPLSPWSCLGEYREIQPDGPVEWILAPGMLDDALELTIHPTAPGPRWFILTYECLPTDLTSNSTNNALRVQVPYVTGEIFMLVFLVDDEGHAAPATITITEPGTHDIRFSEFLMVDRVDLSSIVRVKIDFEILDDSQAGEIHLARIAAVHKIRPPSVFVSPPGQWVTPPLPVETWQFDPSIFEFPGILTGLERMHVTLDEAHTITPEIFPFALQIIGENTGDDVEPAWTAGWTIQPGDTRGPRPSSFSFVFESLPFPTGPYLPLETRSAISYVGPRVFFMDVETDLLISGPAVLPAGTSHQRWRVEVPEDSPLVMGPTDLRSVAVDMFELEFELHDAPRAPTASADPTTPPSLATAKQREETFVQLSVSGWWDPEGPGTPTPASPSPTIYSITPRPSITGDWTKLFFDQRLEHTGELSIYDTMGRRVRSLTAPIGRDWISWDGRDDRAQKVASGTYLLRLITPGSQARGRVVVVR